MCPRFPTPVPSLATALLALLACACTETADDSTDSDTSDPQCRLLPLRSQLPGPAETLVGLYPAIEWEFAALPADPSGWSLSLLAGETEIPGESEWFGRRLTFLPAEMLTPATPFTVRLDDAPCNIEGTFTTGAQWPEVEAPDLDGVVWELDFDTARDVEAPGGNFALRTTDARVWLQLDASSPGAEQLRLAYLRSDEDVLSPCVTTVALETPLVANPWLLTGEQSGAVGFFGSPGSGELEFIAGRLTTSAIEDIRVRGWMDVRSVAGGIGPGLCDAVLGSACEPCADGEEACIYIDVDGARALPVDGALSLPEPSDVCAAPPAECVDACG